MIRENFSNELNDDHKESYEDDMRVKLTRGEVIKKNYKEICSEVEHNDDGYEVKNELDIYLMCVRRKWRDMVKVQFVRELSSQVSTDTENKIFKCDYFA